MEFLLNSYVNAIRVALLSNFENVKVPCTKITLKISVLLYDLGYINGYTKLGDKKLMLFFKYVNNKPAMRSIHLMSTPNKKLFFKTKNIKQSTINNNIYTNSFIILNTTLGFLTDIECISFRIGGQPLVHVS